MPWLNVQYSINLFHADESVSLSSTNTFVTQKMIFECNTPASIEKSKFSVADSNRILESEYIAVM